MSQYKSQIQIKGSEKKEKRGTDLELKFRIGFGICGAKMLGM